MCLVANFHDPIAIFFLFFFWKRHSSIETWKYILLNTLEAELGITIGGPQPNFTAPVLHENMKLQFGYSNMWVRYRNKLCKTINHFKVGQRQVVGKPLPNNKSSAIFLFSKKQFQTINMWKTIVNWKNLGKSQKKKVILSNFQPLFEPLETCDLHIKCFKCLYKETTTKHFLL